MLVTEQVWEVMNVWENGGEFVGRCGGVVERFVGLGSNYAYLMLSC